MSLSIVGLRAYVPAKDFEESKRFYQGARLCYVGRLGRYRRLRVEWPLHSTAESLCQGLGEQHAVAGTALRR